MFYRFSWAMFRGYVKLHIFNVVKGFGTTRKGLEQRSFCFSHADSYIINYLTIIYSCGFERSVKHGGGIPTRNLSSLLKLLFIPLPILLLINPASPSSQALPKTLLFKRLFSFTK
jgi:hypothetical protein